MVLKPKQPELKIPLKKELTKILDLPEESEGLVSILHLEPRLSSTIQTTNEAGLVLEGEVSLIIQGQSKDYQVEELAFPRAFTFEFPLEDFGLQKDQLILNLVPKCIGFLVNDGQSIRVELKLAGFIKSLITKSVQVLTDLTAPGRNIAIRKEKIALDNFVNNKEQRLVARGLVELGEEFPAIRQIFNTSFSQGQILNYEVEEDLLVFEAVLDLELFYLAHSEQDIKPFYAGSFPEAINFRQSVPVSGLEAGMQPELKLTVDELKFDLINRETVEVTATLNLLVSVYEYLELEVVVEAVEVLEEEGEKPSLTYLFAQEGDSIWKLAKQYGVSEEAIVKSNPGLPEKISLGDKIQIPRN